MKTSSPFLSVIIPVYNEKSRLQNIKKIYHFLNQQSFSYEVIIVNDGSTDSTTKKIDKFSKKFKFQFISYGQNKGKGFAIKQGMLLAKGEYLLFTDIDLSTPIQEFNKFLPFLKKDTIIIGSRKTKGSILKKRQGFVRESLGRGFTFLSQIVLNLDLSDFTCGFKCFSKTSARKIFSKQKVERWGFDSEILFLAKKFGIKTKEIPIEWINEPKTKVKFPQDIVNSLFDLLKIRYNWFKKAYLD